MNDIAELIKRHNHDSSELNLSKNSLCWKTGAELKEAFSGIPCSVTSLDLGGNELYMITGAELKEAFSGIPSSVTSLNLSNNSLGWKTGAELKEAFFGIPSSVISLNLNWNQLNLIKCAELKEAFSGIPCSVTSLDLGGNELYMITGAGLKEAFSGIPNTVTSLGLNWNCLNLTTGAKLKEAFSGIPSRVTSLNLSKNNLYFKTETELKEAFSNIPIHLKVNYGDILRNKSSDERAEIVNNLLKTNPETRAVTKLHCFLGPVNPVSQISTVASKINVADVLRVISSFLITNIMCVRSELPMGSWKLASDALFAAIYNNIIAQKSLMPGALVIKEKIDSKKSQNCCKLM